MIMAYRLEMGSGQMTVRICTFLRQKIAKKINKRTKPLGHPPLINLASNEYFKAVDQEILTSRVITPVFETEMDAKNY